MGIDHCLDPLTCLRCSKEKEPLVRKLMRLGNILNNVETPDYIKLDNCIIGSKTKAIAGVQLSLLGGEA